MNNSRIDELLKEIKRLNFLKEETSEKCWVHSQMRINLYCDKAELLGILGQMKYEVGFLERLFGWSPNATNRIETLNSDIKRIEENLK